MKGIDIAEREKILVYLREEKDSKVKIRLIALNLN